MWPFNKKDKNKKWEPKNEVPKGINRSVIPDCYSKAVGSNWDENYELFINKQYLNAEEQSKDLDS